MGAHSLHFWNTEIFNERSDIMIQCPTCKTELEDGAKFCSVCGNKIEIPQQKISCPVCGNPLAAGAKFCSICGTKTEAAEAPKEEEQIDLDRNPTMDEVQVPVIDYDYDNDNGQPKISDIPKHTDDMPTMDSVFLPGQEPEKPDDEKKEDVPVIVPDAPKVTTALGLDPSIDPAYAEQKAKQIKAQQLRAQQLQAQAMQQMQMPQQPMQPDPQQAMMQGQQYPQQPMQGQPAPQGMQPNGMPQQQPMPQQNVTPGKSTNMLIPIILIILIVAVILVDVFVVFRKQIFGDDSSSKKAAVVIDADMITPQG